MTTDELIRALRAWAAAFREARGNLCLINDLSCAADRLEELDERVAIMSEGGNTYSGFLELTDNMKLEEIKEESGFRVEVPYNKIELPAMKMIVSVLKENGEEDMANRAWKDYCEEMGYDPNTAWEAEETEAIKKEVFRPADEIST